MICRGWGWGRGLAATKRNTGVGWEGKMKLRFVKFFTSRENEIEKKEEEEVGPPSRALSLLASPRPEPRSRYLLPPPFIIPLFLSPPASLARSFPHSPACLPPRVGRAMSSSYPCHSRSASLPSFFIKLPKQKSGKGRTVAGAQLAGPAVLPNDNVAAPSSSAGLRLPVVDLSSTSPLSPVSRCGLSTAIGAIGKQRLKMNYPVPSPSLTNK